MDLFELGRRHDAFIRAHKDTITQELSDAFNKEYLDRCSTMLRECDFGFYVGVPLLIVWFLWARDFGSTKETLFPAAILIILGLCVRFFANHVITVCCSYFFERHEYEDILMSYLEKCRTADLEKAKNSTDSEEINELYDYFRHEILFDRFRYHKY